MILLAYRRRSQTLEQLFALWRDVEADAAQFPSSRIGKASGIDSGANVFNKTASPAFGFLMVGKLIFSCSPGLFNCLVEKLHKESAVACELVHCRKSCTCLYLVPSKRFVAGENIQRGQQTVVLEVPELCVSKILIVFNGVFQEICYGSG